MKTMEFISSVDSKGLLEADVRDMIKSLMQSLVGKKIKLTIGIFRPIRSNPQERYYRGVVLPMLVQLMRDEGNDVDSDDVHSFMKEHVWKRKKTVTIRGKESEILKSNAETETMDFEADMEAARKFAAEYFGAVIPLPNEQFNQGV